MRKLTKEEFQERAEAIVRARKIFIPHFTKNISIAFEIYNKMLAEQEYKQKLTNERLRDYNILAELQRPLCPECGKELGLRVINIPRSTQNRNGYRSCWVCEGETCIHEEYSIKTLQDWLETLDKKEEE